jgi:hypothetical protein|tara:strand:+ start:1394 stop:2491 length:1098 start_codon:yes stop_codon:yes gene_type:complete
MKIEKLSIVKKAMAGLVIGAMSITGVMAEEITFDRVELIIPYGPGGGSSLHGRLYSRFLKQTLPGNPDIIMRNVPGAGSVVGVNEFHNTARPDGKTISSIASGTFLSYIVDSPEVRYPLTDFRAFLGSPFGVMVYARPDQAGGLTDDPIENVRKLAASRPVYGGQNAISSDMPALVALHLLGIQPVTLFGVSNGKARAAFERGELNLNYDNMASYKSGVKPLINDGVAVPLFTFGFVAEDGTINRDPMTPEIPTFFEVYEGIHGEPISGIEEDVWRSMMAIRVMSSKAFVLPVGTSDEIYEIYSKAAAEAIEMMKDDPQAQSVLGPYPQLSGVAAHRNMIDAASFSDIQKQWLRDWAREVHQVEF